MYIPNSCLSYLSERIMYMQSDILDVNECQFYVFSFSYVRNDMSPGQNILCSIFIIV